MNKKIHYCWFGGNELPELAIKCIDSWKKYCPDYEIIRWDESNFDVEICEYTKEAYHEKKWAFVSDYARFWILYNYGGLYFDTDVEIIKPIDDLVEVGPFMGFETDYRPNSDLQVAPGLGLMATPGLKLYKDILDKYNNLNFLREDGSINTTTVVTYTTDILKKNGLVNKVGIQNVGGIYIYPREYFCPMDHITKKLNITENTRTIHHYSESWFNKRELYWSKLTTKMSKYLPPSIATRVSFAYSYIKHEGIIGLCKYQYSKRKR